PAVVEGLRKGGGGDKIVFGGGITPGEDVPALAQPGVARVFTPGASTQEIVDWIPHQRASPGGVMDFTLSDEHRRIQETMRDFGEREVKPHAAAWDREERFPHETVQRVGALGFLGVALPEDVGGGGADTLANL